MMPDGHFKVQCFQYKTGLVCRVGRRNLEGRLYLLFFSLALAALRFCCIRKISFRKQPDITVICISKAICFMIAFQYFIF
jgi:hypothetical protein